MKPSALNEVFSSNRLLLAWLSSAAVVTMLRSSNVAVPGYDLTLQIQAAHNLLAGGGLSNYRHAGLDLTQPASLFTLTQYPCGYSLYAAALIAMGVSVATVIKVLGAAATMVGWWGWGRLACPFFQDGLVRGVVWKAAAFAIAILTPLRFTAPWGGTDIVLWATVPWVLHWVLKASDSGVPCKQWRDGLVGAVCGLCVLMRYASLFLVMYVGCLMLWQSRMRPSVLARRWIGFGLGLLPSLGLQLYINHVLSTELTLPGGVQLDRDVTFIGRRVWEGVPLFSGGNYAWIFWLPDAVVKALGGSDGRSPWHVGITVAVCLVLIALARTYELGVSAAGRDPRTIALGLFVALPLMLWICTLLGDYNFLLDPRFYWPLLPLAVFAAYSLACSTAIVPRTGFIGIVRLVSMVYVVGYITVGLVGLTLTVIPGEGGAFQRARVMGPFDRFTAWPSMKLAYEFSPARAFVMRAIEEEPDTLLLTSKALWFYADPSVDQSRILDPSRLVGKSAFPGRCASLDGKYLSGPARILVLTFDHGGAAHTLPERADCFQPLPGLTLRERFPAEGLKVLESRIPADTRIALGAAMDPRR